MEIREDLAIVDIVGELRSQSEEIDDDDEKIRNFS